MSASAAPSPDASAPPEHQPIAARKPRFALFVATAGGLGYFPKAPGTFGSLGGLLLSLLPWWVTAAIILPRATLWKLILGVGVGLSVGLSNGGVDQWLVLQSALALLTGAIGVWSAGRAAQFWLQKDPQRVVIDEVSGQHLTLLIGCATPVWWRPMSEWWSRLPLGFITWHSVLNWKYLLVGLILFRLFDIWKPFPVRQAESLPGGWGIMADDWVAAVYAGIGLWIARAAGL